MYRFDILSSNFLFFFYLYSNASIRLAKVPKPYPDTRPALPWTRKHNSSAHGAEKSRDSKGET